MPHLDPAFPLRVRHRPDPLPAAPAVRVVDLFAGGGGLTQGVFEAAIENHMALDVRLAIDLEPLAVAVYARNFPDARAQATSVESVFDGDLGAPLTLMERRTETAVGEVDVLLGGPPCQGHSNLNNHTRRTDEKNALYLRMARAAEVLRPRLVLIENVPSVVRDRHDGESVVARADTHLRALGYATMQQVVSLAKLGVAQTRRRHVLIAVRDPGVNPAELIELATHAQPEHDLRWAIGDLVDTPETGILDRRPRPSATNLSRMQYMLDHDLYDLPNHQRPACHQRNHSYKSMYGRLRWEEPAQTITSGYGSIGQGRYMHPDQTRALTAREAARIQGFPDYFDFSPCSSRSALATMIGNAVPPHLTQAMISAFLHLDHISSATRLTAPKVQTA
ncbi:DNA cytosine methyltransferase [Microbacterium sp. A1-JK]|uniref:DNA cytosine methyltransferase n=1 Tax=Microbacterium sp. A1-JK TaxID=3177516 RepID=UPI003889537D